MEPKQHATKKPMSQWRNQRGNHKIPHDRSKCKYNFSKSMRYSKSSSKREVYSNTGLSQETRKIWNKLPNMSKIIMKRTVKKVQNQHEEGNNKDQR